MPSLSKKYRINYSKRYITSKNKKQGGRKSIKVYNNRVKPMSRKRKHYIGGDIKVPQINNIFPSGQTYQPNTDCLEKECYKKDDAGEKTTTCLNTQVIMNLFSQSLDASEKETMNRIHVKSTEKERNQVKDLTEKYLTNYVSSLFSKSIFSKNNVDLTPGNTTKLKELLEVIQTKYVDYLTRDSNLSDDIKEKIRAIQEELNVVDNAVATPAPTPATIPAIVNVPAPAPAPATATAPTIVNAPTNALIDNATTPASTIVDNSAIIEAERAKKVAEDAEAERLRLIAETAQAKQAALNEAKQISQTRIDATNKANETYTDAVNEANRIRIEAVEKANKQLDINLKNPKISDMTRNTRHNNALINAENAEKKAINIAERVKNKAITDAETAEENALDAIYRKILAKKNLLASKPANSKSK